MALRVFWLWETGMLCPGAYLLEEARQDPLEGFGTLTKEGRGFC